MGKSEKQKIGAAKAAAKNISVSTYSKTNKQGAPSKVDKIIKAEALKSKDTKRNTGASISTIKTPGNASVGQAKTTGKVTAETALSKAAKVSSKTGENVQNVRSRIKTDVAKTAMRAKIIETRNKNKSK